MRGPYRDGKIHVAAEKCSTCIFRPGNPMHLTPGRLKDLSDSAISDDSVIVCHSTLPAVTGDEQVEAVCRGFDDAHGDKVTPLRLARAMDLIVHDEPRSLHAPRVTD